MNLDSKFVGTRPAQCARFVILTITSLILMLGLYNRVSFRPRSVRLNKQRPSCEKPANLKVEPQTHSGQRRRFQLQSPGHVIRPWSPLRPNRAELARTSQNLETLTGQIETFHCPQTVQSFRQLRKNTLKCTPQFETSTTSNL